MRSVSIDDLGAWLLKASGDHSDIAERVARGDPIGRWCVRAGYRTALMKPGQRVVFWVSGTRPGLTPGIWAFGALTGRPALDTGGAHAKLRVPLRLRWLDERCRIGRDTLRADDRLSDLEVLRQPQAANPSFVTVRQLRAIQEYASEAMCAGRD
jgi:hypothetical protein